MTTTNLWPKCQRRRARLFGGVDFKEAASIGGLFGVFRTRSLHTLCSLCGRGAYPCKRHAFLFGYYVWYVWVATRWVIDTSHLKFNIRLLVITGRVKCWAQRSLTARDPMNMRKNNMYGRGRCDRVWLGWDLLVRVAVSRAQLILIMRVRMWFAKGGFEWKAHARDKNSVNEWHFEDDLSYGGVRFLSLFGKPIEFRASEKETKAHKTHCIQNSIYFKYSIFIKAPNLAYYLKLMLHFFVCF